MKAAEINPIDLLVGCKWATSKSDARRMCRSGGFYIDNEKIENEDPFYFAGSKFIMKFGRKYMHVILTEMLEHYPDDDAREIWNI